MVYASSSAVYGDHPALPKVEGQIGAALSPYALTKHANELFAQVFARHGAACLTRVARAQCAITRWSLTHAHDHA